MKKKVISMLLALTLVVTGVSSDMTVNAAEIAEDNTMVSTDTEENDGIAENAELQVSELYSETDDLYTFNVSENGKAIGSDGVVYDDVVYLSADTVNALDEDVQNAYFAFCDDIATARSEGEDLEEVVVAVDENGRLVFHYAIPVKAVVAAMDELSDDFLESVEDVQETKAEEAETEVQNASEDDEQTEEKIIEDVQTEISSEENEIEEISAEETVIEEVSNEETMTEDFMTENVSMEESMSTEESVSVAETVMTSEAVSEETEETVIEAISTEDLENASEEFVFAAENMELIPQFEEEHFPVIEDVKADLIVDLGYNNSEIQQANSILPKDDWFSSQLSSNQKKIYNACKVMGKGTNKFSFNYSNILRRDRSDLCQAISAYILTEPYKCDWMDLSSTGMIHVEAWGYTDHDATYDYKVTVPKSKYYNAALNKEANAKVLTLAEQAQEYALKNYPNAPVYGITKYFDNWICDNNYYNEQDGVFGGASANERVQESYYYCHSSYGVLLKGYGVCESYALAMTRLLDVIGIPNMYVTGYAGGGHAWNYVQMPDGKWYLQDSTWNDNGKDGTSTENYLLCANDSQHIPTGNRYAANTGAFDFVECSVSDYKPVNERILFSQTELNLLPKKTTVLTYQDGAYLSNENIAKVWSSSNQKVAKVDKNGKVTAVGAGSAEITLTAGGMIGTCTVNVHQINSLTFENGGKASLATSGGMENGKGETQHILLNVNQKAADPIYTAEELNTKKVFDDFKVTSSNEKAATVTTELRGNTIDLAVKPVGMGKTTITVLFGTKKATLNFTVSEKINKSWFELVGYKEEVDYTGKAYKPKVVLTEEGRAKKAKYKVVYKNNKDAGSASVVITGMGNCGGELTYDFTIKPLTLNANSVDTSAVKTTSKVYNGGENPAKLNVKYINGKKKVGLKAGRDYDIEYTNIETKETTSHPTEVGEYTMKVVGKGNYSDSALIESSKTYKITPIDVKKLKVTVKINGTKPTVTVAIGKNVLSEKDYKITFYEDKACTRMADEKNLVSRKQYFAKVESAGPNVTTGPKSKPIVKSFKTK